MFNKGGLASDFFGELLETGRVIKSQASQISPAKILTTVGKQIAGGNKTGDKPKEGSQELPTFTKDGDKGIEDFDPTQITPQQLKQMRTRDKKLSLENYKKIQQELLQLYFQKQQKELPAYDASRPGTARTYEEQKKLIEKKRKEEEEKKKEENVPMPKGKRPQGLGIFVDQKKGSKELGKSSGG